MIRFLADENLNYDIVRGLVRRLSDVDIVCVQDVGLTGTDDPSLLAWAADDRSRPCARARSDSCVHTAATGERSGRDRHRTPGSMRRRAVPAPIQLCPNGIKLANTPRRPAEG